MADSSLVGISLHLTSTALAFLHRFSKSIVQDMDLRLPQYGEHDPTSRSLAPAFGSTGALSIEVRYKIGSRKEAVAQVIAKCDACCRNNTQQGLSVCL
ncbi:hypothetical protein AX14_001642 [Amanita brunnescens Koide BX004]|nr:hypothetical protein AX14_001642 [Amanita brunnescens Koide BX004]